MKQCTHQFDIIIVGAGLTGLISAIVLAEMNLKIAVVDSKPLLFSEQNAISQKELRALALSYGSKTIFSEFNIWDSLVNYTAPIKKVHISDRGHFGFTRILASDYQLPCLGFVIPFQSLQQQFLARVKTYSNVQWFSPAEISQTFIENNKRKIEIIANETNELLSGDLLISAEGSNSSLQKQLNFNMQKFDYQQTAIVANVGVARSHDNTAYERFTEFGPLAFLPISDSAFSLVWTLTPEMAKVISTLDQKEFLVQLQQAFGYRLGRFSWVSTRQCFPLILQQVSSIYTERALLIGNAAHTLHPIAGQGFNLGLRDVAILAREIKQQLGNSTDLGSEKFLKTYETLRLKDHKKIINLTDSLVKIFSNNFPPLSIMRNLALLGIDQSFLKHKIAKTFMGS